jgi:alkylglycerol monooxygenase
VWFKPPGWRPADVAARFPKPPFELDRLERYHPPLTPVVAWFGAIQFIVILQGVALFLWHADQLPLSQSAIWLAALTACLWSVGAVLQGRIGMLEVLAIEAGALATATAAVGWIDLHRVFKPLAMILLMAAVWLRHAAASSGRSDGTNPALAHSEPAFARLLLAALALSLLGDVFLMLPGLFIPGLVSFLLAHLCYIALFRRGVPWFASKRALAITLGAAAAMYAFLFPGLDPVLKVAVAVYACVIALMAAQAIGRATLLRDPASICVAVGAVLFMLSDSLLAINKFATPLPMAQFWVLATYYAAQLFIAHNAVAARAGLRPSSSSSLVPHAPSGAAR